LIDAEDQECSPADVTHLVDGSRMSIKVEVIGGSVTASHFVEEIADKHHLHLASVSDAFTTQGCTTLHVT
jgi:hypothetical protein